MISDQTALHSVKLPLFIPFYLILVISAVGISVPSLCRLAILHDKSSNISKPNKPSTGAKRKWMPPQKVCFSNRNIGQIYCTCFNSLLFYFFSSLRRGDQSTVFCIAYFCMSWPRHAAKIVKNGANFYPIKSTIWKEYTNQRTWFTLGPRISRVLRNIQHGFPFRWFRGVLRSQCHRCFSLCIYFFVVSVSIIPVDIYSNRVSIACFTVY